VKRLTIILQRTLAIAIAALLVAYCGDYLWLRYRVARINPDAAFGSVEVHNYDAAPLKSGKTEYFAEPPQTEKCVRSLFPHMGYTPCWYLSRHNRQYIQMEIVPVVPRQWQSRVEERFCALKPRGEAEMLVVRHSRLPRMIGQRCGGL